MDQNEIVTRCAPRWAWEIIDDLLANADPADLIRMIRKAQRIAKRRQAEFEATPDYLKPLWKGDSNGN